MADFDLEIEGLLDREGGYVNDPDDPGGETKYGISAKSYPNLDIRNLTRRDAGDIYLIDYWDKLRCSQIRSQAVASVLFDTGVNLGRRQAVKLLQGITGVVVDGVIGPKTLSATNERSHLMPLAPEFTLQRLQFYVSITVKRSSRRKYFLGWVQRALVVQAKTGG